MLPTPFDLSSDILVKQFSMDDKWKVNSETHHLTKCVLQFRQKKIIVLVRNVYNHTGITNVVSFL